MPNFCRTAQLGSTGTNTDLQSVLNTQKNQATKTNTCHIFLPKKARNVKVQTQKLLSHPCQLKSGLPPPPPPPSLAASLDATLYLAILLFKLSGYLLSLFAGTCSKNRYYSIFITACYWQKKKKATKHYTVMIVTYEWPSYRIGFVGRITDSL